MIDLLSLLSIALVFFVMAASPGPATVSNAAIAMSQGRDASLMYGAGLSAGLLFWGIVAATGLGVALQSSIYILTALKLFGGGYLLVLAYSAGRDAVYPETDTLQSNENAPSYLGWFFRGLILNVSNPKSVLAWMAALTVGLRSADGTASLVAGVSVCVTVGFITNAMYSFLFSQAGVMAWYKETTRQINAGAAAVFALGGFGLLRSAFNKAAS
ncbi:LysE family translocator [Congregibacter variabilis]|uniref:LysE family translocator n=1 Tax=Congregibacter variabilis TaxID=3081200 RepID=A0ABZ0I9M1_9GAMM|nr:LysE family translocator [Congregibacter sp. IMCC43200]